MDIKFCKRCKLDEMTKSSRESIEKYVESLSDDLKVNDEIYKSRLSGCDKCENLINGVCKLCGCFVIARAAKRSMYCPDDPQKWGKQE